MKTLKELSHLDFDILPNGMYELKEPIIYTSRRFNKTCTVPAGYVSDGASGPAMDIVSKSWWVHDWLRDKKKWDDGTDCSNLNASYVIYDILMKENRWIRARTWFVATLFWGTIKKIWSN